MSTDPGGGGAPATSKQHFGYVWPGDTTESLIHRSVAARGGFRLSIIAGTFTSESSRTSKDLSPELTTSDTLAETVPRNGYARHSPELTPFDRVPIFRDDTGP